MPRRDIRHWLKGGSRALLLVLLAALLVGAALLGAPPAGAATVMDVQCGTPIDISENNIIVRLQPCSYPSMFVAAFPGVVEGNGATIDLANSAFAAVAFGDITIRDLRITNGTRGGLWLRGHTATLERVVVSGNRSTQEPGGGIWSYDGMRSLTLIDSTISDNVGRSGGGLWIQPDFFGGTIRIVRSTISGNRAVVTPGDPETGRGGALYIQYGAGYPVALEIVNSTLSGNHADVHGGALFLDGVLTAPISDSTITGNSAGVSADAIYDLGSSVPNPGAALRRSIVAGNGLDSTTDCDGDYSIFPRDFGYNVISGNCAGLEADATTKVIASNGALLGALVDNGGPTQTHLPMPDSPALDMIPAGSEGCMPGDTDQRGVTRPQGSGCDIGAVEVATAVNQPPVAQCQNVSVNACGTVAASIDAGSSDPDSGDIITLSQDPAGPYGLGSTSVTLTVTDSYGASSSCQATVTVADQTPPVITCPSDQTVTATSASGADVTFAVTASDNCGTVITNCTPPSGSTFPIGSTPVSCTVTDGVGLQQSCGFTVSVGYYAPSGLLPPVDGLPTLNQVKAGQAVPVKFSLGGNFGLNILASGSPTSQPISCDSGAPVDDVEQVVTASSSGLQYDAATNTYTYVWKTNKAWAGTCRQFSLTLNDGTTYLANFTFK